ncbi:MAG: hypothetical protein ACLGIB_09875, partial [Actinomycetota bacterium]
MARRTLLLACLLVAAACDDGGGSRTISPSASPTIAVGQTRCDNLAQAWERGQRIGGDLRGDVTGDGAEDEVYLLRDPEGGPGCTDLLFVDAGEVVLASELSDGRRYALPQPRLNDLADIDGRPGAEIVVDLEQGASTQFVGLFTALAGDLERVRLPGEGGIGDLFPYGGSVGHV